MNHDPMRSHLNLNQHPRTLTPVVDLEVRIFALLRANSHVEVVRRDLHTQGGHVHRRYVCKHRTYIMNLMQCVGPRLVKAVTPRLFTRHHSPA